MLSSQNEYLGGHLSYRAGAHAHDHITIPCVVENGLRHGLNGVDKHRLQLAGHAQGTGQIAAGRRHNRRFTGGVNLTQKHGIGQADDFDEIFNAVAGAAVAVRLKGQNQATPGKCTTRCCQGRRHLDRVMAVIIDHGAAAA